MVAKQVDWVCAGSRRLPGPSPWCTAVDRTTGALNRRITRVMVRRWIRYRADLGRTAPPPADVQLSALTEEAVTVLKRHPDASHPDLATGLKLWDRGLRDSYVWFQDGEPLCMQWLFTTKDDPLVRQLPYWGNMYPPLARDAGQVEKLWTFSTARQKGIATLFEYALFEQARQRGLRTLVTHIGEGNTAARRWADKTGWQAFGTIERFSFDFPLIRGMNAYVCVHSTGPVPPFS